jgi:Phosphotransferase enzyme family
VDRAAAENWIREYVTPTGPIQVVQERPWATVLRVPLAGAAVWFKACGPVQAFEPTLTARLFARWPEVVPEVLGFNRHRAWLLLGDAGCPIATFGNPPELWLALLPRLGELQQEEAAHAVEHLNNGVPDLRLETLPSRYEVLLQQNLPLDDTETDRLRLFAGRFERLCLELAALAVPETVQHDDLHMNNVYVRNGTIRVIDWGDSCISHPFFSLVATFRFLQERNRLAGDDPWFRRLRDAYLEPWGSGFAKTFVLATQVGAVAYAIAALRQRQELSGLGRDQFDVDVATRFRRALAVVT